MREYEECEECGMHVNEKDCVKPYDCICRQIFDFGNPDGTSVTLRCVHKHCQEKKLKKP